MCRTPSAGGMAVSDLEDLQQAYEMSGDDFKAEANKAKLPKLAEVALIHPANSSTIKIRDNGMIDIFVGGNNGIRVDPETKTINMMGNCIKEQGGGKYAWLDSYQAWVKGDWKIEVDGSILFTSKGAIKMKSDAGIVLEAPRLDINTEG